MFAMVKHERELDNQSDVCLTCHVCHGSADAYLIVLTNHGLRLFRQGWGDKESGDVGAPRAVMTRKDKALVGQTRCREARANRIGGIGGDLCVGSDQFFITARNTVA